MSLSDIAHLLILYRYGILLPLAFIEGPILSFISGGLASLGYFNIWILAIVFFVRDLAMDGVYYAIGYFGWQHRSIERLLSDIHIHEKQLDEVKEIWDAHPFRTIFAGKLSYGLATTFIITVGMARVPLMRFYKYSIWVTVVQYGVLLSLGYFFGNIFGGSLTGGAGDIERVFAIIGIVCAIIIIYYVMSHHMRERFIKAHSVSLNRSGKIQI